ncbi:plasmid recombination protein, partial [Gluconobacter sp. P1D12_c]
MNEALRWIQERHGKDNVIAAIIHRDEKTPHLSA